MRRRAVVSRLVGVPRLGDRGKRLAIPRVQMAQCGTGSSLAADTTRKRDQNVLDLCPLPGILPLPPGPVPKRSVQLSRLAWALCRSLISTCARDGQLRPRRSGRVVEGSGFENRRIARYRGFESLLLRSPGNGSAWRGDREAEGTRLLSGRRSKAYRGFESHPLRKRRARPVASTVSTGPRSVSRSRNADLPVLRTTPG